MKKILKLNLFKTFYYNIKLFGITKIFSPRIFIGKNCEIKIRKNSMFFSKNAKLFIGVFESENRHSHSKKTYFINNGQTYINGYVNLTKGTDTFIHKYGVLTIDNLYLGPDSSIICNKEIIIGNNVIISWNCMIIDSDTHPIYDSEKKVLNKNKKIVINNNVWIGCNSIILKGVEIANNIIISASSIVTKPLILSNYIYINNENKKEFDSFSIEELDLYK